MPAERLGANQIDSALVDGVFMQSPPDPAVFKRVPAGDGISNFYREHESLSGAARGRMKIVGGYLRNSDHIFDRDGGKELWLNCARTHGNKRKKVHTLPKRSDSFGKKVIDSAFQTASSLQQKKAAANTAQEVDELHWTQRNEQMLNKRRDSDPALWQQTPWRSLHDGLCTTQKLQFKWNEQRDLTGIGDNGRPLKPGRNRMCSTAMSINRSDYTAHQLQRQDPANMVAMPKERTWDDTIQRLSQPHETRHYRQKQARARPEMTPMQWAHRKFSCEGVGSSG